MPMRSGVNGTASRAAGEEGGRAGGRHEPRAEERERDREPHEAQVRHRLDDVAVGVADGERVLADAEPRGPVAACADADGLVRAPDPQRLVPVAGADAADRGEAGRIVGRDGRVRVRQVVEALRDAAGQAVRGGREDAGDERPGRARGRRARRCRYRGGSSPAGARSASEKFTASPTIRRTTSIVTTRIPRSWPAGGALGEADAVLAQAVLPEGPQAHERPRQTARRKHREAAQSQRDEREPHRAPDRHGEHRAARVCEQAARRPRGRAPDRRARCARRGRSAGPRATGRPGPTWRRGSRRSSSSRTARAAGRRSRPGSARRGRSS